MLGRNKEKQKREGLMERISGNEKTSVFEKSCRNEEKLSQNVEEHKLKKAKNQVLSSAAHTTAPR